MERLVSGLLRAGVLLSGTVVLAGGILQLWFHGREVVDFAHFTARPPGSPILRCGVLLLIMTPVARVLFCLIGFIIEGNRLYTAISGFVLTVLLVSNFRP